MIMLPNLQVSQVNYIYLPIENAQAGDYRLLSHNCTYTFRTFTSIEYPLLHACGISFLSELFWFFSWLSGGGRDVINQLGSDVYNVNPIHKTKYTVKVFIIETTTSICISSMVVHIRQRLCVYRPGGGGGGALDPHFGIKVCATAKWKICSGVEI